jgi:hypothetical protein
LTAAKTDQQTFLALFNYYFKAVDIKNSVWTPYPHFVTGVAIGSQPLKRALFGIGYGPYLANIYAGLLLHTYQLPTGVGCGSVPAPRSTQSTTLVNKTCPEFSIGLNVGVGSVLDTLKNKGNKSSK